MAIEDEFPPLMKFADKLNKSIEADQARQEQEAAENQKAREESAAQDKRQSDAVEKTAKAAQDAADSAAKAADSSGDSSGEDGKKKKKKKKTKPKTEDDDRETRRGELAEKIGEKSLGAIGGGIDRAGSLPGEISGDISLPVLTGALDSLTTKVGGFFSSSLTDRFKSLIEATKMNTSKLDDLEETTKKGDDEIAENTEKTADALEETNEIAKDKQRDATEARRERAAKQPRNEKGQWAKAEQERSNWLIWLARLGGALSVLLSGLATALLLSFGDIEDKLVGIFTGLKASLSALGPRIGAIIDDTVKPALQRVGASLRTIFDDVITKVGEKVSKFTDDFIKPVSERITNAVKGVFDDIAAKFPALAKFFTGAKDTTQGLTQKAARPIAELSSKVASRVAPVATSSVVQRATGFVSGLLGRGKDLVKGAGFKALKKIPIVGPAIELYFLSDKFKKLEEAIAAGEISQEDANKLMALEIAKSIAAVAGATLGAVGGAGVASIPLAIAGSEAARYATGYVGSKVLGIESDAFDQLGAASSDMGAGSGTVVVDASQTDNSTNVAQQSPAAMPTAASGSEGDVQAAH